MCNGSSVKISQGGSIAVLRPTQHVERGDMQHEMRLLFSNGIGALLGRAGTHVEFQGWQLKDMICQDSYWVVIHRDGDLTTAVPHPLDPLFSFSLNNHPSSSTELPQRLHLGVGDAGIIGRRVSVMTSSTKGPIVVAEGIIGWN